MPENLATNPKAQNNVSGWIVSAGTGGTAALTQGTAGGPTINGIVFNYVRATWSVASTTAGYVYHGILGAGNTFNIPQQADSTYSASVWVRYNAARTLSTAIYWYDATNTFVSNVAGPAVAVAANTWTQLKVENAKVPTGATQMLLLTSTAGNMAASDTLDFTAVMVVQAATIPTTYFDGDSANAVWAATANNSSSTLFTDYLYMYKKNGVQINDDATVPFIDVDGKVQGLDLPDMDANIDDIDATHGGIVHNKFTKPRIVVVEGTVYADPDYIEVYVDQLITNFIPDDSNYPFYFKHPGVGLRYVNAKPLALKMDVETLRRIGSSAIQIQLACEDPRKYIDNADQVMTAGTSYTPANPGNVNTYPIFTVVGAFTAITFTNNTQAKSVTLTSTRVAGDITVFDFRKKTVTINGVQSSNQVTTANWWDIPAGGGQTVKYTVTGGPPTSVTMSTKQGWL